jgi:hypothetical protein
MLVIRFLLVLLALVSERALSADILHAHYAPAGDELVVEIAYRGTNPHHDFTLIWGECRRTRGMPGDAVARLVDQQGSDVARSDYRVRQRLSLVGLECRPAVLTLRLGRVSTAQVYIPARG